MRSSILRLRSNGRALLIDWSSLASPYTTTFLCCHVLLDPFDVSVCVVGLRQILLLEPLHLALPHLEDVALDVDDETRLNVAPEGLIVAALEACETSS